ncbi:endoglucanase [Xylanibacter ruminicola]|nr:endoglucanase [Xylanibacter ruminicola]
MESWLKDILHKMLLTASPSGSEEQITALFAEQLRPFVDEVTTDVNGNCIAHKQGTGPKVMIMAHADEIGLMISYIDDRGFLYFKEIGGIDTNLLPGQRVNIMGQQGLVTGVIGKKPIHLQDKSENTKQLEPEDLWIDIAAKDKSEAQSKVQIGDVATLQGNPVQLNDTLLMSRSLDDKIGLAVLMGLAQNLQSLQTDKDIYLVASVQEELGARGAKMITEAIRPDIGIAIDVTHATDYPTMSPTKDGDISLGKGAVIPMGPNMSKGINQQLISLAKSNGIPYQIEAIARPTGTDAREIQVAGTGIRTGLISIPCRYMHTPSEVVSLADADSAITLLSAYLHTRE